MTYLSQIFLVASFVFLLQFGVNLMTHAAKRSAVRAVPVALLAVFIVTVLVLGMRDILKIGPHPCLSVATP